MSTQTFHEKRCESFEDAPPHVKYTSGRCAEFALALNQLFGYEVVVLWALSQSHTTFNPIGLHALCRNAQGQYLDVNGVQTEETILKEWRGFAVPSETLVFKPVQLPWKIDHWTPNPLAVAQALVYIQLERPDLSPPSGPERSETR